MSVVPTPDRMPPAPETGQNLTEIRWHARGGQGAVTAAKMVAELALGQGKYFQAFPEYGPERSGAPIVAFTRVSDEPIQLYCGIEHPADRHRARPLAHRRHRRAQGRARATPSSWSTPR